MGFTADPTLPNNGENIGGGLGASRIRNVTSWLLQFFGFSGIVAQTINVIPFAPAPDFSTTGRLVITSDPTLALGIATKQYVDAAAIPSGGITNNGAGNGFIGTLTPAFAAYKFLQIYSVQWDNANVGGDTLALNGLASLVINKTVNGNLVPLEAGDIPGAGVTSLLVFDGLAFQLVNNPVRSRLVIFGAGSNSWRVPNGVTAAVVDLYGAGGGGGGGGISGGGGGGGAGAHVRLALNGLTPGSTLGFTVGSAGGGGAPNTGGTAGGNTIIFDPIIGGNQGAFGGQGGGSGVFSGGAGGAGGLAQVTNIVEQLTWVENEAGLVGATGTGSGQALGGGCFRAGGAGGAIGGNSGNAGTDGVLTIQW